MACGMPLYIRPTLIVPSYSSTFCKAVFLRGTSEMGKRGPAPKGEYGGKSKVFSTRIRPDLRESLDSAARSSGRSLSQEVEHRLRRTFIEDEKIGDAFGSRQNFLIMRIVALTMQFQWNPFFTHGWYEKNWLDDPLMFDQVRKTVNRVLEAIRPRGPVTSSVVSTRRGTFRAWDPEGIATTEFLAHQVAHGLWKSVQEADPSLPLHKGTRAQHLAGLLKSELGEIASRPRVKMLTKDDLSHRIEKAKSRRKRTRRKS
jgi:hypothetical protein